VITRPATQLTTRRPISRWLAWLLPASVGLTLLFAIVAPADWGAWRILVFISAFCWGVWLTLGWPQLTIADGVIEVRNVFVTWQIPLGAISSVDGGRGLLIHLRNGRRVPVNVVSRGEAVLEGMAEGALGAENYYFTGDARGESPIAPYLRTEATEWAFRIRVLLREVAPQPTEAVRHFNHVTIATSVICITALLLVIASG
jgi:hypothetical protein